MPGVVKRNVVHVPSGSEVLPHQPLSTGCCVALADSHSQWYFVKPAWILGFVRVASQMGVDLLTIIGRSCCALRSFCLVTRCTVIDSQLGAGSSRNERGWSGQEWCQGRSLVGDGDEIARGRGVGSTLRVRPLRRRRVVRSQIFQGI